LVLVCDLGCVLTAEVPVPVLPKQHHVSSYLETLGLINNDDISLDFDAIWAVSLLQLNVCNVLRVLCISQDFCYVWISHQAVSSVFSFATLISTCADIGKKPW
jgi:hypothetical protein